MPTLREARDAWFTSQDLPLDGGYTEKWVKLPAGPFHFYIPNTASRKKAVPLHDLHHLVTGYETDWAGEYQISAWEIGAGCGGYSFAWLINFQGMLAGAVRFPLRTFRAFARGRRCQAFYTTRAYDEQLLDDDVDVWKEKLGTSAEAPAPTAGDAAAYAMMLLLAFVVSFAPLVVPAVGAWWLWSQFGG